MRKPSTVPRKSPKTKQSGCFFGTFFVNPWIPEIRHIWRQLDSWKNSEVNLKSKCLFSFGLLFSECKVYIKFFGFMMIHQPQKRKQQHQSIHTCREFPGFLPVFFIPGGIPGRFAFLEANHWVQKDHWELTSRLLTHPPSLCQVAVPKSRMVGSLPFSGGSLKMESSSIGLRLWKKWCTHLNLRSSVHHVYAVLSNPCLFLGSETRIRVQLRPSTSDWLVVTICGLPIFTSNLSSLLHKTPVKCMQQTKFWPPGRSSNDSNFEPQHAFLNF